MQVLNTFILCCILAGLALAAGQDGNQIKTNDNPCDELLTRKLHQIVDQNARRMTSCIKLNIQYAQPSAKCMTKTTAVLNEMWKLESMRYEMCLNLYSTIFKSQSMTSSPLSPLSAEVNEHNFERKKRQLLGLGSGRVLDISIDLLNGTLRIPIKL